MVTVAVGDGLGAEVSPEFDEVVGLALVGTSVRDVTTVGIDEGCEVGTCGFGAEVSPEFDKVVGLALVGTSVRDGSAVGKDEGCKVGTSKNCQIWLKLP